MLSPPPPPLRLLLIDDNTAIHEDYQKILGWRETNRSIEKTKALLFGSQRSISPQFNFELTHAMQGEEGLECVRKALAEGRPYAVAFIDIRMPPGLNGIETTARIRAIDSTLQVVICTAYSDYSWSDIRDELGASDSLLILKKPSANGDVLQLAYALTTKWQLMRAAQAHIEKLETAVERRTHATILLVEHEQPVADFAQQALAALGYRVLRANSGAQALTIWERESETISLLFTDLVLPGDFGGKQLAEKMKSDKPNLHVIYTSGDSLDLVESTLIASGSFLPKPYTAALLAKTIRRCCDSILTDDTLTLTASVRETVPQ